MEYHVSTLGCNQNTGTKEAPFRTISRAAEIARAGDTVIVHGGTYREWVKPMHSGVSEKKRITYCAAEGEQVIIKGSEVVENWEKQGDCYVKAIPNAWFGDNNPFAEKLQGDWLKRPLFPHLHTGAVYIDGVSLAEQLQKDIVAETAMSYYADVTEKETILYANFGTLSPDDATVEIHVRKYCFAPEKANVNYITISGFEMAHAATNWAPPTAQQDGLIWARWCKGWIIEHNRIHDSRCSGISLGREGSLGDNLTSTFHEKSGFRTQLEVVFRSLKAGWSKENHGGHIVRNNEIYHCGQTGIVGHMGSAFSEIYGNHIHHIADKEEFMGWEIGGIKLHAAIDTYIHHNCIHNCHRGLWLDWQAQGVRVSSNVFFDNGSAEDMLIEVTHGPHLVDHNIFLSQKNYYNAAQGGAYIHNWFGGEILRKEVRKRYTPYHFAHSTDVLGTAVIVSADERFYQNVFCDSGIDMYNGCPDKMEDYIQEAVAQFQENGGIDVGVYWDILQPVYASRNLYTGAALPFDKEKDAYKTTEKAQLIITEDEEAFYAEITLPEHDISCEILESHDLPQAHMPEQLFETADGKNIVFDTDIAGERRGKDSLPGPIASKKKVVVFRK